MKNNKTLSDATREATTSKHNKFANSLMPVAPKSRVEPTTVPEPESPTSTEEVASQQPSEPAALEKNTVDNLTFVPAPAKPERVRKSSGLSVDDIVSIPAREGDAFNKMVRVTDDHHELLRLLAFKYRKPMNVIVHNLIALLDQAYQKEQKGDTTHV